MRRKRIACIAQIRNGQSRRECVPGVPRGDRLDRFEGYRRLAGTRDALHLGAGGQVDFARYERGLRRLRLLRQCRRRRVERKREGRARRDPGRRLVADQAASSATETSCVAVRR